MISKRICRGKSKTMSEKVTIREMTDSDPPMIAEAFTAQGWNKPVSQYLLYWQESLAGKRLILLSVPVPDQAVEIRTYPKLW
jgi:hypothetical protein